MRGGKVQEMLMECERAYGEGNYSRLDWACNRILDEDKDNETALTYKLYIYCDWRQHHLVLRIADKIKRLYPANVHAHNARAIAYIDKGEFERALECCEEGLKIKDYHWLRINRIESLIGLGRIDEAFEFFNASEIPDYTFTDALINCGRYSEISRYGSELSKSQLMTSLFKRCEYLDRRGKREEILEVCDEIFKIDEDNESALQYKIHALAFLGRADEVLRWSDYAIRLYPDNFRFYLEKAETLLWSFEDIDGAIECYEKGFGMVDDFDRYWFDIDNLVEALTKKADQAVEDGDYQKAVEICDEILFYKPSQFRALDMIDGIVENHDVRYEPTGHYRQSLMMKIEMENRFDKIDDYLNAITVGEYDLEYVEGCSEFKDYASLADYLRDIMICLMQAYPGYGEEASRRLVKIAFENVRQSFELEESAYDFAVTYGFGGG